MTLMNLVTLPAVHPHLVTLVQETVVHRAEIIRAKFFARSVSKRLVNDHGKVADIGRNVQENIK